MVEEDNLKEVGEIVHYFNEISVGVVKCTEGEISVGDEIRIKGSTTEFDQKVDSLQIDREDVEKIEEGEEAGMKVKDRVREGDKVYLKE